MGNQKIRGNGEILKRVEREHLVTLHIIEITSSLFLLEQMLFILCQHARYFSLTLFFRHMTRTIVPHRVTNPDTGPMENDLST